MKKQTIKDVDEKLDKIYENICKEINIIIKKQNELDNSIKKNNTDINNIFKKLESINLSEENNKIEKINSLVFSLGNTMKKYEDKNKEFEKSLNVIADNLLKAINDIKMINDKVENPPVKKINTLKSLLSDLNEIVNKYE